MSLPDPVPCPPLRREWWIAAAVGAGLALTAVLLVAYVESSRFPPARTAEEEAHEWGTPRPAPDADPDPDPATDLDTEPDAGSDPPGRDKQGSDADPAAPDEADDVEEAPVIDVRIDHSPPQANEPTVSSGSPSSSTASP